MKFFQSNLFCLILTFVIIGFLVLIGTFKQVRCIEIENQDNTQLVVIEKNGSIDVLYDTPMQAAIPYIKKASVHYDVPIDLFLGIAFAESSFRQFKCFNPWGIGVGGPRCYNNWEHSVNGFAQLIKYYYLDEGRITAEQILMKYVGWNNQDWVRNVKTYWDL